MRSATEKGNNRDQTAALFTGYECQPRLERFYNTLNLFIILIIVFCNANVSSGKTPSISGVQIELGDGNRICMSFEGKIKGIIVNGIVNLPGKTFENITRVGNTKISRNHSGMLTQVGHTEIFRDWRGNIFKIGDADVLRDKQGSIIAINGDPHVSPLFVIDPP